MPPLQIIPDAIDYKKMVDIYNLANVFVSPTRADAFNIPCIEAMACGLPTLTTNFGGQTDYVTEDNGWIVGGELTKVEHELMYEEISWLTPSIEELRTRMRYIHNNPEEVKQKSLKAIETAKHWTWDHSAQKIGELI